MMMVRVMLVVSLMVGVAQTAPAFLSGDDKGKAERDCYIGLDGYSADDLTGINKSGSKLGIRCTDCDPSCDLDGVASPNGSCTFRIGACVNVPGVPGCDPSARTPKKVKARAKSKADKLDLSIGLPTDLSSACGALVDFEVPLKGKAQNKAGKGKVMLLATKPADKDKFTFVCDPRPAGEACPAPTTTTTNTVPTTVTTTSTVSTTVTSTSTTTVTSTSTTVVSTTVTSTTTTTSTLDTSTTSTSMTPTTTTSTTTLPPTTTTTTSSTTSTSVAPTTTTSTSTTTTTLGSPGGSFVG